MNRTKTGRVACFYILAFLFVLLLFSESQSITNHGVIIPFIKFNETYLFLAIIACGAIYALFRYSARFDVILFLLFGRIFLSLLPMLLYDVPSDYFGNFVIACFPFFVYLFFLNVPISTKNTAKIFLFFGVMIALQCFWAYFLILKEGYATYNAPYYKDYFVIPAGATNLISGILLPLLILGDQIIERRRYRWVYTALLAIAIFLCKSRTGIVLVVIYFFTKLVIKGRKGRRSGWINLLLILMPFLVLAVVLLLLDFEYAEVLREFMLGFAKEGDDLDGVTSGRLTIYRSTLQYVFSHHYLLGNGVSMGNLGYTATHNVFLEILYQNGLVGLVGFVAFLVLFVRTIYRKRNADYCIAAFGVALPFIFLNALFEDTMICEFMILFGFAFLAAARQQDNTNGGIENVQG